MSESTTAAAARALKDPVFAQEVLNGDEYPAVKQALIADLEGAGADVTGYWFQNVYVNGQKVTIDPNVAKQWLSFSFGTLSNLAGQVDGSATDGLTVDYPR